MLNKVKYIVVVDKFGNECPIIFPETIIHKDMAKSQTRLNGNKTISAGFVVIEDYSKDIEYRSGISVNHKLFAHGRSDSLNIDSRQEDTELLNRMFYGRSSS